MKVFRLLFVALAIFITIQGCRKTEPQINSVSSFESMIIADDFDFRSSADVNAIVSVSDNDKSVIEIYTKNPAEGGELIKKGLTDNASVFNCHFVLPLQDESVYVVRRSMIGFVEEQVVEVSSSTIYCTFGLGFKSISTNTYLVPAGTYPDCSSAFDYDIPNNASGNLQVPNGDVWRLDAGKTYDDGKIKFLGTGNTLIICGTAVVEKVEGKGTIVITGTGSLKVEDDYEPGNGSKLINYGDVEIKDGGSWKKIDLKNGLIENHGTMEAQKIDKLDNTDLLNTGTLTLHDKLKIKSANLSNDGTLTCEKIEFDNTSCIVENFDQLTLSEDNDLEATMNNYSGTVHFDKKLEIKSSGEFNNACKLLVDKEFKVVGDLGNEGYIEASEDLKIENGATVNVYSGSLISAKDFELNTSIVGTSTGYAKIEVEDDTELKSGSSLVGKIDLCDADGTIETNNATIGSDVTYCVNEVPATDCVPGNAVVIADQDSDGVPDTLDEYPADASRAFNSYYPNAVDDASIAFEDLWPAKGDYDFNDLVVDFSYQFVTNANNDYVDIIGTYEIKAVGATLDNGFGISFDIPPTAVASVTGITHTGSLIQNATNGLESGHANKSVIVVYDNIGSILGNMTNTSSGGTTTTYTPTVVTITLGTPQTSIGTEPFNPFIYINQIRGREVHLVNNLPTALADNSYFGQNDDATDSNSSYYKTINNYPWAIEVPTSFDYPVEKVDIVTAHTKFGPWAESSGASFTNWYENQPGFRNTNNIY